MKAVLLVLVLFAGLAAQAKVPVNPNVTPNDPMPGRVLDCGGGVIKTIADRFGSPITPTGMGSTVLLTNGTSSVSYDFVQAIADSKVGDHVLVCLVFIPDPASCPPGDFRGRIYTITNLRTLDSWTLPDTQHSCGGA